MQGRLSGQESILSGTTLTSPGLSLDLMRAFLSQGRSAKDAGSGEFHTIGAGHSKEDTADDELAWSGDPGLGGDLDVS